MREMPEMIDHTEHQRAIDLNDHTVKEIREPQLVRVVQHDGAGGGQDLLRAQLARGPGLLFGDRRSGRGCQHGKAGKAYQKQRQRTQQRRADADMDKIADDGSPLKTGKKPPYITP